jgi:hypothetical protein
MPEVESLDALDGCANCSSALIPFPVSLRGAKRRSNPMKVITEQQPRPCLPL